MHNIDKYISYNEKILSLDNYIIEKLHLNKDNKCIMNSLDIEEFIDSFNDDQLVQTHILLLIKYALDYVENSTDDGIKAYIVKSTNERKGLTPYKWSSNTRGDDFKVGDTTRHGSEVVFIITKSTELPEKYKKMMDNDKY